MAAPACFLLLAPTATTEMLQLKCFIDHCFTCTHIIDTDVCLSYLNSLFLARAGDDEHLAIDRRGGGLSELTQLPQLRVGEPAGGMAASKHGCPDPASQAQCPVIYSAANVFYHSAPGSSVRGRVPHYITTFTPSIETNKIDYDRKM